MKKQYHKVLLVILDGFGVGEDNSNNAAYVADTPFLDKLFNEYPHTLLEASGPAVGLPQGQIGNSEVGHITMGCGCIIEQDLVRINKAIEDGSFFENLSLDFTIKKAKANNRPLHMLGLVSDGGVHSHIRHLIALIDLIQKKGVQPILHMITDGRDTSPRCAREFVDQVMPALDRAGGEIASVIGRYYAMDRDNRWERTRLAWEALALGKGLVADNAYQAIENAYTENLGDEFIVPTVLQPQKLIRQDDRVIFFNFRNDRPRQLVKALSIKDFDKFDRGDWQVANVATMTEIDKQFPCLLAFAPNRPRTTLSEIISSADLKQFHCAETEKYPHITFFFNGGNEECLPGEEHKLIPSPRVATYDLAPEMNLAQVADEVITALNKSDMSFVVTNFANTDMVGHTAIPDPIIRAVETVDQQLNRVVSAAIQNGWQIIVTSDHGNCDEMVDPLTKEPNTRHTSNPVPCIIVNARNKDIKLASGKNISNIAPTVLDLIGLKIPAVMDAESLIID